MSRLILVLSLVVVGLSAVGATAMAAEESWTWGQDLHPGGQWEVTPVWDEYVPFRSYTNVVRHRDGETVLFSELEAEYAPLGRLSQARFTESNSMAPYIEANDLVYLSWYPVEVELGDVIGTWQNDCPFTHRVYSIAGDVGYRVWGDNMLVPDRCIVEPQNVLYKVVGIVKGFYD